MDSARCPECGGVLSLERLDVEGDDGLEVVYFLTCPRGDFDLAVTDREVVDATINIVMERLRSDEV